MITRSAWSLPLVPVSFFGIVLGLIGLGNPWRVAVRLWGLPSLPGELIVLAGVLVWAVVIMLFSAKWNDSDEYISREAQRDIRSALAAHSNVIIHGYPERNHALARHDGAHFHASEAAVANRLTYAFLQDRLVDPSP